MNDRTQGNGTVLGIGALAAGVVGVVAAAIMNRDSDQDSRHQLERRFRQVDALSRTGTEKTMKTIRKTRKAAPKNIDIARERASHLGSQVTSAAASGIGTARSRIDVGDLQHSSQRFATALKERSRDGAARAESVGSDITAKASELVSETRNQVPNLKDRAGKVASDAMDLGSNIGDQVRERLPEVRDQVENRVRPLVKDLRKQAKPLLNEAASSAAAALGVAGTKAHDAREWAGEDALPVARETLGDVSHLVAEKARNAERLIGNVSADASGRLSEVGSSIEDRSRQAATVAVKGTKDTGSLLFWTTVGAGIVFYAFLSKEQREQAKAAGRRVATEAREIYRDIQGYDGGHP